MIGSHALELGELLVGLLGLEPGTSSLSGQRQPPTSHQGSTPNHPSHQVRRWLPAGPITLTWQLRAVAYRMLGAASEADDAVQEAWLRLRRADASSVENPAGRLTRVVARVCLVPWHAMFALLPASRPAPPRRQARRYRIGIAPTPLASRLATM
jgi:Sigma-70 region 2